MKALQRHLKRNLEVHLAFLITGLFLWLIVGCTEETPRERQARVERGTYSTLQGEVPLSGGGVGEVRTLVVDGTKCILVGRYNALSVSCDWGR